MIREHDCPMSLRSGAPCARARRILLTVGAAAALALAAAGADTAPAFAASGGCRGPVTISGPYSTVYLSSCISSPYGALKAADAYASYSHNVNHSFSSCTITQRIWDNRGHVQAGPTSASCTTDGNQQRNGVHYYGPGAYDWFGVPWHNQTCVSWTNSGFSASGCVDSPEIT